MEQQNTVRDDLTLKEVILTAREYFWYLWRNKWWFLLALAIGAGVGVYRAISTPITYTAEMTFMINEDEGSDIGGIGAVLGQFGLGTAGGSEYNLEKIAKLAKSRRIVHAAILDSIFLDGTDDLIANHIIKRYKLEEFWKAEESIAQIDFKLSNSTPESFSRAEHLVLNKVYNMVVGTTNSEGFFNLRFSEMTGILSMSTTTNVEELSIQLTKDLYESLSEFYVTKSIEKQQATFDQLDAKRDSIEALLKSKEYELASFGDRTLGVTTRVGNLRQGRIRREVSILTIMFGEATKNLETADFLLKNAKPFFQVIDNVYYPVKRNKVSKLKAGIIFGLVFVFIAILFLIIYRVVQTALALDTDH